MSSRASTPAKQRPTCGPIEPPVTPGPGHSTPTTPRNKQGTALPHTPQRPHISPSADGAQQTPGGSRIECTLDESLYKKVEIHTAKCTECDKHNHEVMRRCPGCTFQICTPCYNERLSEGRTLLHAQMKKPGTPTVASPARAARVKIDPSTPHGSKASMMSVEIKQEDAQAVMVEQKERAKATLKSTAQKRKTKKPKVVADSEPEMSFEDEFDPEDRGSPTPASKRRRTELTFAESAAATAVKSPPATRATRRTSLPGPGPSYRGPSPSPFDLIVARKSVGTRFADIPWKDQVNDQLLYDNVVAPYDEPLLGRRDPVMSNPVAVIPARIKRGGLPQVQPGEAQERLQNKAQERLQKDQKENRDRGQEETHRSIEEQRKQYEDDNYSNTVQWYVEKEASNRKDTVTVDEDDFADLFKALDGIAAGWARRTWKKLNPATQMMMKPGMGIRLDIIDRKLYDELADLLDDFMDNWNVADDAGPSTAQPAQASPGRQFRPV